MALYFVGPSGGVGGALFNDASVGGLLNESFVASIDIWAGRFVDAIQFYIRPQGTLQQLPQPKRGGDGGDRRHITLGRDTYIVGIHGRCGLFVDSINIRIGSSTTNATSTVGPLGGPGGDVDYLYEAPLLPPGDPALPQPAIDVAIVGVFGRAGRFIDQIGVLLQRPRATSTGL